MLFVALNANAMSLWKFVRGLLIDNFHDKTSGFLGIKRTCFSLEV
ncbi:hypothetical protein oki1106_15600 [Helicobacter pylori]